MLPLGRQVRPLLALSLRSYRPRAQYSPRVTSHTSDTILSGQSSSLGPLNG